MPLVYRAMLNDNGKPVVGNEAKMLGVRVPPTEPPDVQPEPDGTVRPGGGGMSVAPEWRKLPAFLIPARLKDKVHKARGSNRTACFRMGAGAFVGGPFSTGLQFRTDKESHGLIEPDRPMHVDALQAALETTRDEWQPDED